MSLFLNQCIFTWWRWVWTWWGRVRGWVRGRIRSRIRGWVGSWVGGWVWCGIRGGRVGTWGGIRAWWWSWWSDSKTSTYIRLIAYWTIRNIATHAESIRNADSTATLTNTAIPIQRKAIRAATADISRAALPAVTNATGYAGSPHQGEVDFAPANSILEGVSVLAKRTDSEETVFLAQGYAAVVEVEGGWQYSWIQGLEETSVLAEAYWKFCAGGRGVDWSKGVGVVGRSVLEEDKAGEVGGSHQKLCVLGEVYLMIVVNSVVELLLKGESGVRDLVVVEVLMWVASEW